jgi:O-antigen ligase
MPRALRAVEFVVSAIKHRLEAFVIGLLIFSPLLASFDNEADSNVWSSLTKRLGNKVHDPEARLQIFICLTGYLVFFVLFRIFKKSFLRENFVWLGFVSIMAIIALLSCPVLGLQALIFLGGITMGQVILFLNNLQCYDAKLSFQSDFYVGGESVLFLVLFFASVCHQGDGMFKYGLEVRRSGPWENPNIYGVLMGVGFIMAAGWVVLPLKSYVLGYRLKHFISILQCGEILRSICLVGAGMLFANALLSSYSRGASIGAGCGLVYLFWQAVQSLKTQIHNPETEDHGLQFKVYSFIYNSVIRRIGIKFSIYLIILVSITTACFWQIQGGDLSVVGRAVSIVNRNDFSWRNRVDAWVGALQIISEQPWVGRGWENAEPLYENYYLPSKLDDGLAIEMNDYLMLGATLGIPALFCFGMYLWLSLTKKLETRNQNPKLAEVEWLQITCRAGAIVLLVGFWFDGGLFKLATGSTFWILLELGNVQNNPQRATNGH